MSAEVLEFLRSQHAELRKRVRKESGERKGWLELESEMPWCSRTVWLLNYPRV
jgi:hypothetical protein